MSIYSTANQWIQDWQQGMMKNMHLRRLVCEGSSRREGLERKVQIYYDESRDCYELWQQSSSGNVPTPAAGMCNMTCDGALGIFSDILEASESERNVKVTASGFCYDPGDKGADDRYLPKQKELYSFYEVEAKLPYRVYKVTGNQLYYEQESQESFRARYRVLDLEDLNALRYMR